MKILEKVNDDDFLFTKAIPFEKYYFLQKLWLSKC